MSTLAANDNTPYKAIHWISIALVILLAWVLAGLTLRFFNLGTETVVSTRPLPPARNGAGPGDSIAQIGQRVAGLHLFGKAGEVAVETEPDPRDAPETSLNLRLAGVVAYHPADMALAIISAGGREEEVYGIGDKIVGNASLKAVFPDRVIIENRGREEVLKLPEDVAPVALPSSPRNTSKTVQNAASAPVELPSSPRELRDKLVQNPSILGKIVAATPYQQGGKLVGFRLQPKQNSEILEAQGIMANDVITQVNGIALNSQKQGIRALRNLVKANSIELTVLRDGVEMPVMISLDQ
ncbi:type II secretion system protein GspC [Granulosicoccaceae sp. 1_MG-2023]|nr:type II secretion system protein GspC [Granulosicoccaceae sp. 1_MG-2023]